MKSIKMRILLFVVYSTAFIIFGLAQERQAPAPPPDGTVRCHNVVVNGQKPNCACWGRPDQKNPQCKPPGEDPKCTNHCKYTYCDCEYKCQS